MTPADDYLLLGLFRIQSKIKDYEEQIAKNRIKEAVLSEEIKARGIDLNKEMPQALDRFMESF